MEHLQLTKKSAYGLSGRDQLRDPKMSVGYENLKYLGELHAGINQEKKDVYIVSPFAAYV